MFNRLHKACLCLSHQSTISIVDEFGEKHDKSVVMWQNDLLENLTQVSKGARLVYVINMCI